MKNKSQVARYGLHFIANDELIINTSDRVVFQRLIDMVRIQLSRSIYEQTVKISLAKLGELTHVDPYRTLPGCIERLEKLGLITKYKNGIKILCNEYVAVLKHYESLSTNDRKTFAKEFQKKGTSTITDSNNPTKMQGCTELIGLAGNSIVISDDKSCNNVGVSPQDPQNPTFLQDLAQEIAKTLHFCREYCEFDEFVDSLNPTFLQGFCKEIAETLHFCRGTSENPTFLQGGNLREYIKCAFDTGHFPESLINDLQKSYIFVGNNPTFLQDLTLKILHFCRTVIIYIINKRIKEAVPLKSEVQNENFQEDIQKGFEGFGKVEILDLDKPSKDFMEIEDISQQTLKRAERSMRARNSYRNKPFIKVERAKEIVDRLDEVVQSPVDFFLYQFWDGIYNLYCDHYHPSQKIDEEGDLVDEPQNYDWKEMIGAALPQDEIYSLAKNVYEDMTGAIEQGRYVYGDNNEWEVKFGFKTFQDFNPYEIFQWSPCTMQDKSVPALKVAIDRFYDIEANDVFISSKGDKRTKNSQNKKLISLILSADDSDLSPIESAIKNFYRDFVISGEENIIDEFTDGKGTALESGGGLPDHLLKPWCYSLPSVGYNEFTGVLNGKYKPCDGVHKKAYIFSAENVVEWNERNGYTDTIAHKSLQ